MSQKVIALLSANEKEVISFGEGDYVGDEIIPKDLNIKGFGEIIKEAGIPNPKIVLDSGEIVWGCECWWGPKDKVQEKIDTYISNGSKLSIVLPSEYRAKP